MSPDERAAMIRGTANDVIVIAFGKDGVGANIAASPVEIAGGLLLLAETLTKAWDGPEKAVFNAMRNTVIDIMAQEGIDGPGEAYKRSHAASLDDKGHERQAPKFMIGDSIKNIPKAHEPKAEPEPEPKPSKAKKTRKPKADKKDEEAA